MEENEHVHRDESPETIITQFCPSPAEYATFFMISVRSPWASSSGVGGSGRFGGPGGNCGGVDGAVSSESTLNPGLYEIGLRHEKRGDGKAKQKTKTRKCPGGGVKPKR